MATSKSTELAKARLDPGSVFETPEELVNHPGLKGEEKADLLRRWAYDASELAVAEEEGMVGGEGTLLRRILLALDTLTGGYDVDHTPPTKQGSVRCPCAPYAFRTTK
jgi:hypothetical protein